MKRIMTNERTGQYKEVKEGFSWTVLFWGIFPPLFRGDWKWLLIMLILAFFTAGISNLVFPFIYNKLYINDLIEKGYRFEKKKHLGFFFSYNN